MDHVVLELILPHLSIGDVFRLRHALGKTLEWDEQSITRLLVQRDELGYSLRTIRSIQTMEALGRRMRSHGRCTECGTKCHRHTRVCKPCACDPSCFFALLTRRDIRECAGSHKRYVMILSLVRPAHRGRNYAYLYWKRQVDEALRVIEQK